MHHSKRYIIAIAIALFACASLHAQPQTILVGASANAGLGIESANIPVYATSSECGTFESGSATFGSFDARMVLPMFFTPGVGIDTRLRVAFNGSRLTAQPVVPTTIRDAESNSLVTLDREFRIDRSTVAVAIDLLARTSFGQFNVGAGVSIADRISSTTEQTDNVLGPGANRFPDGQSARVMATQSSSAAPFAVAPMLTASYAIPIAAKVSIAPELTARIDLLSSVKDGSWRSVEFALGAALMFDLTPPPTPIDAGPLGE
jgi:hypothetical protein